MDGNWQQNLKRVVVWAALVGTASAAEVGVLEPRRGLKPFEYLESEHPLPNYQPGGDRRAPGTLRTMQKPLSPADSQPHLVLPEGFRAELFAAEPDIAKPICLAWDERGRLWIAETVDYPNEMQNPGQGRDRIKILEDTNGDGRADKFTVFADRLSIPTSIVFANGGLIVTQAPDTLFLKDTDGDGRADVRQTLFSGWGTGDTHAGPSNLRWGFDNWIWGVVGYSGFQGEVGGQAHRFTMGFHRFTPDGRKLEFVRSSNNNTWGFAWSEDGIAFGSTANNNAYMYMPIPNRYYEAVSGWSASRVESIATSQKFKPVTDKIRQVDVHGGYTAAAGAAIYTARQYPREYWNRVGFVTEPTGHLIGRFRLEAKGADFVAHNEGSFLASDDEWTAPIMAEVGPDGQVWMIDWYNYIVQHNPTPLGFKTGKGNAYETPLRDKTHGRIYRLVHAQARPEKSPDLSRATPRELVNTLKHSNLLWRMHAQRLLVERGQTDVFPALFQSVRERRQDALGLSPGPLHALWTLHGLGAFSGANQEANTVVRAALKHPTAAVRRAALMVLPRTEEFLYALLLEGILHDDDAQVRLAALLALAEMPVSEAAGHAAYALLTDPRTGADKWLQHAVTAAAARHDAGFLQAVFASLPSATAAEAAPRENLLRNASFEDETQGRPLDWQPRGYRGEARHELAAVSRAGARSVRIESATGADTSWFTRVAVKPGTEYQLSAWIKTENLRTGTGARGALLNVHELGGENGAATPAVKGTTDWTLVETTFNSGTRSEVSINCLFGGWGTATGTAWFDDLQLTELSPGLVRSHVAQVLRVVTGHYAQRGAAETIVPTLAALQGAPAGLVVPVLEGLAGNWPAGRTPALDAAAQGRLVALMKSLPNSGKAQLLLLAGRWGRADLFGDEVAALTRQLVARVGNRDAKVSDRVQAAREAVSLNDTPATVGAVLAVMHPLNAPELSAGLIAAIAESRRDDTGPALVGRFDRLTPAARRAAVAALLRRPAWARALLQAVEQGRLQRGDLAVEHWQQLKAHADRGVAGLAAKLASTAGTATSKDMEAMIRKLLPLADKKGDAARGKQVFEANCLVCHQMNGVGGRVGPDLTGFGSHPKVETIVAIVDPNRSVEANYRLWNLTTKAGDTLAGRLDAETQTSVDLLDTAGQKHVVQRRDIVKLEASNLSLMPEGFGALPEEDLLALLEFLSQSGHAKK